MAHLTCVGANLDDLHHALQQMDKAGIDNVLSLRGDPPGGEGSYVKTEGGFDYASQLAELANQNYNFCLVGACYPEVHPEATDLASDLRALRKKIDGGVRVLITQLFFDNEHYFRFVEAARAYEIDVPIIPGIMPITNFEQLRRFTSMCGAAIPSRLFEQLQLRADDPTSVTELGVSYATLQCAELLERGAPGIHFYTLNKSPATRAILSALKLHRPWARQPASLAA
jgi:methylenetetrahydrofolate reductase (NADPH)